MAIKSNDLSKNEYFRILSSDLRKFTPQLFYFKKLSKVLPPKPDSSAVLLTIEERFFLVTAAHTFHKREINHVGIMTSQTFVGIDGNIAFHEPNEEDNYEPDNFDMAVVELDNRFVNELKNDYNFLLWEQIIFYQLPNQYSKYVVWGYPEKLTTIDYPTKKISSKPLLLLSSEADKHHYLNEQINDQSTLVIIGETKIEVENKIEMPAQLVDFEGLSGCGVWFISDSVDNIPQYGLVSIITGSTKSQSFLYSTRVNVISAILKKNFKIDLQ